ncbi:hypothetical protein CRE_05787 [Caenorhabditis remanei]|uniref:Uncharacterized protein n=1 Tax=Caenorhabditis remanei TaxID=31234 RepID=E3M029_CAERE|nr:hypothetical protein CRE_05787 [Caenorhabditis remanei]
MMFYNSTSFALYNRLQPVTVRLIFNCPNFLWSFFWYTLFSFRLFRSTFHSCFVFRMFTKFLIFFLLVTLLVSFASADFSCFFGDWICKHITCRNCEIATCVTGDCVCTICT